MPHRQVVLTIPGPLRAYCPYRRRLLGEIARVAARTVMAAIRTLTGEPELSVGIVACLQTHGSLTRKRAKGHPPLHLLVTVGGFRPDGAFVSWPAHDTARLTEAFRRAVLRLFVRLDRFDEDQASGMLTWPHSGFHVQTAVWVSEDDRALATRLARYGARNPVAVERLTYDRTTQAVTSRSDKSDGPTAGTETVDPPMRIVACITRPSVIDQILTHLRTRATTAVHGRARRPPSTQGPSAPGAPHADPRRLPISASRCSGNAVTTPVTAPIDRLYNALAQRYRPERVFGGAGMSRVFLSAEPRH